MARSLNYRQTKRPRNWKRTWPNGIPISPANRPLHRNIQGACGLKVHVQLAAPLNTCPSSHISLRTVKCVTSISSALSHLRRVYLCVCYPIQLPFAAVWFLVNFPQTVFDRRQNDDTNESLLSQAVTALVASSPTIHSPDIFERGVVRLSHHV